MQCKIHPEENGVNTCNECGSWLCDKCSFERGGRIFCPSCAAQQGSGSAPAVLGTGHRPSPSHVDRSISWGLLFLFSVIIPLPGLNYMYMGFIKRGLVAMSAFFGSIYLVTLLGGSLSLIFVFAIPVLWFACAFDGFRLRARINAGEVVTDNIDDITSFVHRNRTALIGLLLLILAINVVGGVVPTLVNLLRRILPVLIIIWATCALFRRTK